MPAPIVLVGGTWSLGDSWWKPSSPLAHYFTNSGLALVHPTEPYRWTGRIGGLADWTPKDPTDPIESPDVEWAIEGRHLVLYCAAFRPGEEVSVVAHSHGGHLAALAIVSGQLKIRHFITLATPPRRDMRGWQHEARKRISGHRIHLYGDWFRDPWIHLGQLGRGNLSFWSMEIPEAENVHVAGVGHSELTDPRVWAVRPWLVRALKS